MLRRIRGLALAGLRLFEDDHVGFGGGGSDHDLHVIVGDTGTGKTTLCHALTLGLCGTTPWVSAANVSIPVHEATDGPATATVSVELDASDGRYRVERSLTEPGPDEAGETTVGAPQVQRQDGTEWLDLDAPDEAVRRLTPPETERLLAIDPGLHRAAQSTGWSPLVRGQLTAAAAGRAVLDDRAVSPEELWEEFGTRLGTYVDIVGPSPRYEVTPNESPFDIRIEAGEESDRGSGGPGTGMSTGASVQFALAMTLAAGDCARLPQWFDAPLGRLDHDDTARLIEGLETAAERRQIVVLPHEGGVSDHPELRRNAATEHRLELVDTYRAEIADLDRN